MLKPVNNYLMIEKEEPVKQTSSGIFLTSIKEEVLLLAKVIATCDKLETSIKVNDLVVYKKEDPFQIIYQNKAYLMIKEELIIAIKENEG